MSSTSNARWTATHEGRKWSTRYECGRISETCLTGTYNAGTDTIENQKKTVSYLVKPYGCNGGGGSYVSAFPAYAQSNREEFGAGMIWEQEQAGRYVLRGSKY